MKANYIVILGLVSTSILGQVKKDSVKQIEGITIEAKKKLIERKADRMIYNVEASLASQGMDAVETLANVPLMKVDENKGLISIIGKSSVSVMINGRMLNLSGDALMNYLKTFRSENIAKIEIITTPPAKYEAQGNSGIVNIILKKNPNLGFSGNINALLNQRTYTGGSTNLVLNYKTEKLSLSFKTNYLKSAKRSEENYSILGDTQSYSRSVRKDSWESFAPSLYLSYKLTKNSEIGFNYLFTNQSPEMDINNKTRYFEDGKNIENLTTPTQHREKDIMNTLSVYYDIKLDTIGKKLSFSGNYYHNNSDTNVNFNTTKSSDDETNFVRTKSLLKPEIFSGQTDLELPYSFGKIETGAKFTQFKNSSDLSYFNLQDNQWISDVNRTNIFSYDEKNWAAYFSFSKNFGDNLETKVGVRYELADIDAITPSTGEKLKYNYGQWFPSAYVSYKEGNNVYSLSYSRRINRPDMDNLNPFRWYENSYSYSSGNPLLQPSYINNYELSYTFKNKLMTSLYYLHLRNAFGQVIYQDGLTNIGTYLNHYDNDFFGLNVSYTEKIKPWWETSVSANASLMNAKIFNIDAKPQKGQSLSYTINNTLTLNKAKTLNFFLNYSQTLPFKNVNSKFENFFSLDSGIKWSLMDKQLQVNASVSNIFAQRWRGTTYFENNVQNYNNYWDGRAFRLSVNYTFGNKKVMGSNRKVDFEERDRAK